jgi:hypothetical protein
MSETAATDVKQQHEIAMLCSYLGSLEKEKAAKVERGIARKSDEELARLQYCREISFALCGLTNARSTVVCRDMSYELLN